MHPMWAGVRVGAIGTKHGLKGQGDIVDHDKIKRRFDQVAA